jgi:peptidoglycan lytic transglycosylase
VSKSNVLSIFGCAYFMLAATGGFSHELPHLAPRPHVRTAPAAAARRADRKPRHLPVQVGIASWYGPHRQGMITASGQRFDLHKMTAAHNTLPFNTKARVINLENGRSVEVTINDRGPHVRGRIIDLSEHAARRLGMKKKGLARVEVEPLGTRLAME